MRILIAALVLLGGCATQPQPAPELPKPGRYAELDALLKDTAHRYAKGDKGVLYRLEMVLARLTQGVDLAQRYTVPGLRAVLATRFERECADSHEPGGEACHVAVSAERFFTSLDVTMTLRNWPMERTYTAAEFAERSERALVLYRLDL